MKDVWIRMKEFRVRVRVRGIFNNIKIRILKSKQNSEKKTQNRTEINGRFKKMYKIS